MGSRIWLATCLTATATATAVPSGAVAQEPPLPTVIFEGACGYCLGSLIPCEAIVAVDHPGSDRPVGRLQAGDTLQILETIHRVVRPKTMIFRDTVLHVYPVYGNPDSTLFLPGDTLYELQAASEGLDPFWWYRGESMRGYYRDAFFSPPEVEVVEQSESELWHLVEVEEGRWGWVQDVDSVLVPNHYDSGTLTCRGSRRPRNNS